MFVGDYLIRREDKYTPIIGAAILFFLGIFGDYFGLPNEWFYYG